MKRIGILGGMGPAAGVELTRLFLAECGDVLRQRALPITDQAYPAHMLLQLPFPDRTTALLNYKKAPLGNLLCDAIFSLQRWGADVVGIACNTAHAWHHDLQDSCPSVELLHVGEVVVDALRSHGSPRRVGLLATKGTYLAGIYDDALALAGMMCLSPTADEQDMLMRGIYDGVKAGDIALAREKFSTVANALRSRHDLHALILGCTEIPLALEADDLETKVPLLDPAALLAKELAKRAYG